MGTVKQAPLNRVMPISISREHLANFKCLSNHVLLKQHSDNTMIKFNDTYLQIDPSWKPEFHVDRVFTVVALPDVLTMRKMDNNAMPWKCDMVLRVGDRVWINYLNSIKPSHRFECEGDKYILINYAFIYLALRPWDPTEYGYNIMVPSQIMQHDIKMSKDGTTVFHPPAVQYKIQIMDEDDEPVDLPPNIVQDSVPVTDTSGPMKRFLKATSLFKVVMVNGYVLIDSPPAKKELIHLIGHKSIREGVVVFYGKPNQFYDERTKYYDDNYITGGHTVQMRFNEYAELEDPLHRLFPYPNQLKVTQRRYLMAVINRDAEPINLKNFPIMCE